MFDLTTLAVVVAAYLIGSLSFAVIVSRVMGLNDPRSYGSKNPGATNVLRSGSKKAAIATLLLDGAKGWLPVWLVAHWGSAWGLGDGALAAAGMAAFLGHLFPLFFGFKGGKGVATAAGVLLGFEPLLGLATLGSWLFVALVLKYSSLAAVVAALFAPGFYVLASGESWSWYGSPAVALVVTVMSLLLLWRHRGNISRLLAGQEGKIGSKK